MKCYIVQMIAGAVGLISALAVISYPIGIPALRKWSEPPMSANTAWCLMFIAFAVAILAACVQEEIERNRRR